jgi:hypothetical protein
VAGGCAAMRPRRQGRHSDLDGPGRAI